MAAITSCLVCQASGLELLMHVRDAGIPHEASGHNFAYASTLLLACQQCGSGILQKYSHDCWNYWEDEDWDMYWWYVLDLTSMQTIRQLLETCPAAQDPSCNCTLHLILRGSETIYGGIQHANAPSSHADFARLTIVQEGDHSKLQLVQKES
ncbi:hypothetical protein [Dictyobacter aurantiacus]|uniref:Uncharacterized protein n=1 Tax=Dictyobacter aurantiacus TaxID=1936993 RepID=A0A401ZJ64_9CHLR|nr:hypothetical protein [Dictyobacter aurantiacus]GCE06882.1 hypothetical protein KDAU_42110 [Dictyobacter aurantiacus]